MADRGSGARSQQSASDVHDFIAQVEDYAIIALDPDGVIRTWNLGAQRLKGYSPAEAVGRHFSMFYPDEDQAAGLPLRLLAEAREKGRVEHSGWRVRKDGNRFWGDVVITALHDDAGEVTGFAKVTRDQTTRHDLEESLRQSEERLRLLVGQVSDYAIIALDPQGVIESWNLGAERLKGYPAEDAVGRHFSVFYTLDDRRAGLPSRLLEEARTTGRAQHQGWRLRRDGTRFWGDVVLTAVHDATGHMTGFAKVTRDLTERHALEEQLRQSEERLRLLVGQVTDYAIIALDPVGTVLTWNLGAEKVKGWTAEEIIGRNVREFYTAEEQAAKLPERLLDRARTSGRVHHSGPRLRKDGTTFRGDVTITALHDESGALTGFAKVTRDRTEIQALEDAQNAFYNAFEHDFRSPLTALKGFVEAMREASADERAFLIERAEANADKMLRMVESLLHFAKQRTSATAALEVTDLDLAEVARQAVSDLPPELEPRRVQVQDVVAPARADRMAMGRVVTNLVGNALKYSPPGSPVRVTFDVDRDDRTRMHVRDEGRGIHPDDLATIFDERERGRYAEEDGGSGVGLSSVRDLLHQQNGLVVAMSQPTRGTTMTVDLPSVETSEVDVPPEVAALDAVPRQPDTEIGPGQSSSAPTGHPTG